MAAASARNLDADNRLHGVGHSLGSGSAGLAVVILEHAAQPLAAGDAADFLAGLDNAMVESWMIAFAVVMGAERPGRAPQRCLAEQAAPLPEAVEAAGRGYSAFALSRIERTVRARTAGVNGFCSRLVPGCCRPWRTTASSV
jgi:hypothetical protein